MYSVPKLGVNTIVVCTPRSTSSSAFLSLASQRFYLAKSTHKWQCDELAQVAVYLALSLAPAVMSMISSSGRNAFVRSD
jgi:hypothetical protein